jgi:hypothetical protein
MMKFSFIILIYAMLFLVSCGNKNNVGNSKELEREETVILESQTSIVDCGNEAYAYAFKFKSMNSDSVFIGLIKCPDGYGDNYFTKDKKYIINYTNKNVTDRLKSYVVINPFEDAKLSIFLITDIRAK